MEVYTDRSTDCTTDCTTALLASQTADCAVWLHVQCVHTGYTLTPPVFFPKGMNQEFSIEELLLMAGISSLDMPNVDSGGPGGCSIWLTAQTREIVEINRCDFDQSSFGDLK